MIAVAEYMDTSGGGFEWGVRFPKAGHFSSVTLCFAGASVLLCTVFLALIPPFAIRLFPVTGLILILSCGVFHGLIPSDDIGVYIEGTKLQFNHGRAFFITLAAGAVNIAVGLSALVLRKTEFLNTVSTFFELDYDTPWTTKALKEHAEERRRAEMGVKIRAVSGIRASMRRFRASMRGGGRRRGDDGCVEGKAAEWNPFEGEELAMEEVRDTEEGRTKQTRTAAAGGGVDIGVQSE